MNGAALHILFAGGGTGGHLFPALAIAEEVGRQRPGTRISFAGTPDRIEARLVPPLGYGFTAIRIRGFRRRLSPETLLFPLRVAGALLQSARLLRRLTPDAVVGTGGYVCGPVVFMATLLGIPTLIQEQNSYPGATTRLLARRATEVHLTFEETRRHIARTDAVFVSGNPTRGDVGAADRREAGAFFGLDPGRTTLLVSGGSLGARSLNRATAAALPALRARGVQVLWQTGAQEHPEIAAGRDGADPGVRVLPFIARMDLAYAAADLALCRAGATTLAELTLAGVPAILVPYPHAAADHQTANARTMVEGGAAVMIPDAELDARLPAVLADLLEAEDRRRAMSAKARALARPEAAATVARAVLRLAESHERR